MDMFITNLIGNRSTNILNKYISKLEHVKIFKVDIGHEKINESLFINIYVSHHVCENTTFKIGDNITANIWLTGYFEK